MGIKLKGVFNLVVL